MNNPHFQSADNPAIKTKDNNRNNNPNNNRKGIAKIYQSPKTTKQINGTNQILGTHRSIKKIINDCNKWQQLKNLQSSMENNGQMKNIVEGESEEDDGYVEEKAKNYIKNSKRPMSHAHLQEYNPHQYEYLQNKKKYQSKSRKVIFPHIQKSKNQVEEAQGNIMVTAHIHDQHTHDRQNQQSYSSPKKIKNNCKSGQYPCDNNHQIKVNSFRQMRRDPQQSATNHKLNSINVILKRYKDKHEPMNASFNRSVLKQNLIQQIKSSNQKLDKVLRHLNQSPIYKQAILPNRPKQQQVLSYHDKIVKKEPVHQYSSPNLRNSHKYLKSSPKHKQSSSQHSPSPQLKTDQKLNNSFMMINPTKIGSYEEINRQRKIQDQFRRMVILKKVIRSNIKKKNDEIRNRGGHKKRARTELL